MEEKKPRSHKEQLIAPPEEKEPLEHVEHALILADLYLPAAQAVSRPLTQSAPAGQAASEEQPMELMGSAQSEARKPAGTVRGLETPAGQ